MYVCPGCGGNLRFDIPSQQLACEYCGTQADPYSFEDKSRAGFDALSYEVTVFTCPACGGEIVSADNSAAEFCSFCGASTILHNRLRNEKRPTFIIPFKKTKEDCKSAYGNMMKKAYLAPDGLKDPRKIDSFRGIYMPYWAFYVTQQGAFAMEGRKSKRRGDYVITDHYDLKGSVNAYYKGLSYDASSSFDDKISEKLAPFDVKDMKDFTPAFLSGFYADTADVDAMEYEDEVHSLAVENTLKEIYKRPEYMGYNRSGSVSASDFGTETKQVDSTMFPVWFMSYRNGDRVAYATVNGQTGKVVADLPVEPQKYMYSSLVLAIPIFLILMLLVTLTPPTVLVLTGIMAALALGIYYYELAEIKKKEKIETNHKSFSRSFCVISLVLAVIVMVLQPVSDLFYYGVAILAMSSVFYCFRDIINYYNIMSTRRLPQFDKTGGDDRG